MSASTGLGISTSAHFKEVAVSSLSSIPHGSMTGTSNGADLSGETERQLLVGDNNFWLEDSDTNFDTGVVASVEVESDTEGGI